jgi:PIN like domain
MRLLLDEDVPIQLLEPLRHLLPEHRVDHVDGIGWKGKKDRFLLQDAARRGYEVFVTNDNAQLDSTEECRAIRDSGLHHVRYDHETKRGMDGLALAVAAVVGALRQIVRELEDADGQRLVHIQALQSRRRHRTIDPRQDPPPYWPTRAGQPRRRRQRRSAN